MPVISGPGHLEARYTRSISGRRPAVALALMLLLSALLPAGCGQAITISQARPTPTPTSTSALPTGTYVAFPPTVPPAPLSWVPVSLPTNNSFFDLSTSSLGDILSVAPNDGRTAYICAAPPSLSVGPTIWVTHDLARHWTRLAPLPAIPHRLTQCFVVPDAVDSSIAVVELSWARMNALGEPLFMEGTHFVTFDGGEQWQPLTGPRRFDVRWLATYHGTTMAVVEADEPGIIGFWISHDYTQTWQMTSAIEMLEFTGMSINPTTGELLLVSTTSTQLEKSDDYGLHWTSISPPLVNYTTVISAAPAGQPWRICVAGQGPSGLMCSIDSGKTWSQRPQLVITYTVPYVGQSQLAATEYALAPDGTIYADLGAIPNTAIADTLYRLAPGSDQWQSLGISPVDQLPQSAQFAIATLPDSGLFWWCSSCGEPVLYNP